jgi:hypothetical protein
MPPAPVRHVVTVWNPHYAPSAMDDHLSVLLDWARRHAEGAPPDEDVYVWWAKLASAHRPEPMRHRAEVLALGEQAARAETHLYITEYRSLYVAHVADVVAEDVREDAEERAHIPAYYFDRPETADCWFQLWDIRRLVSDDGPAVADVLRRLLNTRHDDHPVSLYGGMVEMPLLVRCAEEEPGWFSDRASLLGETRWVERDGQARGETERLAGELRDNLIGREGWARLSLTARGFLSTGEAVYRRHRDDLQFDFSSAAIEYAKAIEVELNALLRPGLVAAGEGGHVNLGRMAHALEQPKPAMRRWLDQRFGSEARYLTGPLARKLSVFAVLRNRSAHAEPVSLQTATALREETLGIGQEGLMVRLARCQEARRG